MAYQLTQRAADGVDCEVAGCVTHGRCRGEAPGVHAPHEAGRRPALLVGGGDDSGVGLVQAARHRLVEPALELLDRVAGDVALVQARVEVALADLAQPVRPRPLIRT